MTTTFERLLATFSRAPFFTGREPFLQGLRETLLRDQVATITGPSGVGKTAVALEYAYRFAPEYQMVFLINAITPEAFQANAAALIQGLSLPLDNKEDPASLFQAILTWLSRQQGVLLVLDHIVALRQLRIQAAQQHVGGHVIIITRSSDISPELSPLKLESLDPRDGALLALRRAGLLSLTGTLELAEDEQQAAALELARELRGSPLALSLAGGYLRATGCTLQDYLLAYREYPARLRRPGSLDGTDGQTLQSIEVVCHLALSHLEQEQPAALELLNQCAFLSADGIPAALFQQEQPASPESERLATSPVEAARVLLDYGLLDARGGTGALTMHELLQAAVRRALPLDRQQQQVERALRAFHRLLLTIEEEPLAARLRAAGHIRQLATLSEEWTFTFSEAAEVLGWAASLLWEQGSAREAESLLRKALVVWERTLGPAHPTVATVVSNLATLNTLLKNYPQAEELARRATATKARALGVNHPDVLLSLNNLARIYEQQEKQGNASLCYQKAIEIGERVGLQQDPNYILSLYELALLTIRQGQLANARPWLEKVCVTWERSPGFQDPSTIRAWHKLAEISVEMEDWEQALACYQRVVPAYEAWLGAEHPATLGCLEEAADVLVEWDELAEAEAHLQYVLSARERLQGADHPEVAACLNRLANIALRQERPAEARARLARAQHIYESRPEPEDAALAAVLDNVALLHTQQNELEQAISTLERALAIRKRALGDEHLDLVETLSALAHLYLTTGRRVDQVEPLLLHALAIYQHAQKPEDLTLDPVLGNLARIEATRGRFEQARMFLERLYAIRTLALGENAPEAAEVLQNLAMVALAQGQQEEVEKFYQRACAIYKTDLEQGDGQTLAGLRQMAALAVLLGKVEEAESVMLQVLAVREREPGEGHSDLGQDLMMLRMLCALQGRFAEAEAYRIRARALSIDS